ncbi:GNAT family N-acetyltransferase [Dysgonomonas sp. BGC7]|uniref:GNAT family N-acetyltransferase n=1 Tax=Dysgonomonas sp. BGC7 TaxID=1658008 RepID=UPI0006807F29|nr:GNAT family N-acetyltransferase [Dysgonomonas sp. BGC7]MBD8388300.1 GNAT family N-acetyltransferase [Dysgonomonas sp. BGC7]
MNIVEANKEHIFIIKLLSDQIWPHTFKDILSPDQISYMMEMMYSQSSLEDQMSKGHHYLLANEDGEYLGYVSYELNYKNSDTTKIHKIYVLPSTQGKGVGRFFIDSVADIAKANGNKVLSLNVNRFNKAIDFYKRIGFEVAGSENIDIGDGFLMEDFIMNKKLK